MVKKVFWSFYCLFFPKFLPKINYIYFIKVLYKSKDKSCLLDLPNQLSLMFLKKINFGTELNLLIQRYKYTIQKYISFIKNMIKSFKEINKSYKKILFFNVYTISKN